VIISLFKRFLTIFGYSQTFETLITGARKDDVPFYYHPAARNGQELKQRDRLYHLSFKKQ